jgi:hypothetical protein
MTTSTRETIKARKEREKAEAQDALRKMFPVGSTVTTVLAHVSQSGMQRGIKVMHGAADGSVEDVSWLVARATETPLHNKGGLKVNGCGMDMGFHVVYGLSRTLYGAAGAFRCNGKKDWPKRCPSNDHSNDRGDDYVNGYRKGRIHSDGGYALRHRWA